MLRPLSLIAILSFSAGEIHGRTTSERDPRAQSEKPSLTNQAKPRVVRRVLFRTEPPRLVAPANPKPAEPVVAPVRILRKAAPIPELPFAAKSRPVIPVAPATLPRPASPRAAVPRGLVLQPTTFTPYDRYLGSVHSVIAGLDARSATMPTACELMREGRAFRYQMTDPYRAQSPSVTEARRAGDCKSKALWIYDHLGDTDAYYTIGKLNRGSRTSHAWVYWRHDGRWWILDPTERATPIAADSVSSSRYVPYYSFSRAGTFRHPATRLMLAMGNGIPAAPTVAVRARTEAASGTSRESRR